MVRSVKSFQMDTAPYREKTVLAEKGASPGKAVLVLRYELQGKTRTRVWRGASYYHVIAQAYAAAKRRYEGKPSRLKAWGPAQDRIVLENYREHSSAQIARMLREKFKQKYTKNMVISRYHRLKEKERRNDD